MNRNWYGILPTISPNSKPFHGGWRKRFSPVVFIGILTGLLSSGCVRAPTPESFFNLMPESAKHRALQTRIFETSREKELLSASAAVLQDLGFQIEERAVDLGVLRASKERSAREIGQEIMQGLLAILSVFGQRMVVVPVDLHQQIAATLASRQAEGDAFRFRVRIVFHRTIWKSEGYSGNQTIPAGDERREMIIDPQIYHQFFAKLSKGMFLEAHKI